MVEEKMPFTEHLGELRKRIIFSLISIVGWFVIIFNYSEKIFQFLTIPLHSELSFVYSFPFIQFVPSRAEVQKLVFLGPAEAFWMHIKISMIAALVFSLPVILFHVWKFIAPGLLQNEKKYVGPFIIVASLLFVLGTAFCFFIVLPFALGFLLTYKTGTLMPMLSVGAYTDFCLKFILAFGLVFELPIVILFLTRIGLITTQTLRKNRKYALLIAFILAAILTPTPDAFNQSLMAVPILILYEVGIIVSRIFPARRTE
ncbi:MAG: twin arginine-targeting protein translocase TatC [Thermoplasmata archaeon M9B2D]|nr:MAG: twin arginine-targeting protein translocase TatC [Thermoplasmata archaeon M9B2D]